MPLPTFVSAGASGHGTGAVTPGLPAGWQENDIFLLFIETDDQAVATPSGWTQFTNSPVLQSAGERITSFWRRATASETAPTLADPGDHQFAAIFAFRGCPLSGVPFDVVSATTGHGSSTTATIPGFTTTLANDLVVIVIGSAADTTTPQFSAQANADLTSVTEIFDEFTTDGNGGGFCVVTGVRAVAGVVGNTTATLATNTAWAGIAVALIGANEDATTVPIHLTPSSTEALGTTESATVYLDLLASGLEAFEDAATVYLNLSVQGGECFSTAIISPEGEASKRWSTGLMGFRWDGEAIPRFTAEVTVQDVKC